MNPFESQIRQMNDHRDVMQRNEKEVVIEIQFQKCTLQQCVEPLADLVVYCKREFIKVLQRRVSLVSTEHGFVFCPLNNSSVHGTWQKHAMSRLHFPSLYNAVRQNIMKESNKDVY